MPRILQTKSYDGVRARRSRTGSVVVPPAQASHITPAAMPIAAFAAGILLLASPASHAVGIESVELLPSSIEKPAALSKYADEQKQKLAEADEAFKNSDTLKGLLARSEANKAKNRRDVQNKYCYRQAELGVGDCGGLRYIPGLTESGKQKTPQWLADLLGVEVPESNPSGGKTLKELIYEDDK